MSPSKVAQAVQELFRVSLCRSDDIKLACSTLQKHVSSSSKVVSDIDKREQERVYQEDQILKELASVSQDTFQSIDATVRKITKKMLHLILAEYSGLIAQGPSHLQLACIMGEPTADERVSFGKIKANGFEEGAIELTENNVEFVIEQYKDDSLKFLQDCVERSRDKFNREYHKLETTFDQQTFFTEKGVEKRCQRLKFRNIQNQSAAARENENQSAATAPEESVQTMINMLRAHNTKTAQIINGFNKYQQLREKSKAEGIPFE